MAVVRLRTDDGRPTIFVTVKHLLTRHWFLFALGLVLVVGIAFSKSLEPLADIKELRYCIVATVLFLMALPLEASAMWRALRSPGPTLLAASINFVAIPLTAWAVSGLLSQDMAEGLFVAAATPCTLASASVWTRRAGGNDAVAIMVTVITNLSCFILTPLWLYWMTGQSFQAESLQLGPMMLKLGVLVVLPMTLAQLLRLYKPIATTATKLKPKLGLLAMCGVLSMIFLGSIRVGVKLSESDGIGAPFFDFARMLIVVLGIHLLAMALGLWLAFVFGFKREDRIAVGIAGSQKTLMVGLQMGLELKFSVLPMVVYHVGQLLLDTIIADRLRKAGDQERNQSASANK